MAFRAILESVEYRNENLDYLVHVIYTDGVSTKVRVEYKTDTPTLAWLQGTVTNRLRQLTTGDSGIKALTGLLGQDITPTVDPTPTPEQDARNTYLTAKFALQRAAESIRLGILTADAPEYQALVKAAQAAYLPDYVSL